MSVGFQVAKGDIDSRIGLLAVQLRDLIMQVTPLKLRLEATTDTDLTVLGYTVEDVALIRATVADLYLIQQIALGQTTLTTPYDFRTNTSKVTGIN